MCRTFFRPHVLNETGICFFSFLSLFTQMRFPYKSALFPFRG